MFISRAFSVSVFIGDGLSKSLELNHPPSCLTLFSLVTCIVTLASVTALFLSPSCPSFLEASCIYELKYLGAWIYPVIWAVNDLLRIPFSGTITLCLYGTRTLCINDAAEVMKCHMQESKGNRALSLGDIEVETLSGILFGPLRKNSADFYSLGSQTVKQWSLWSI